MKELLQEIDELLAHLEDFTHGKDGKAITEMRYKIQDHLKSVENKICMHDFQLYSAQGVQPFPVCIKCGQSIN